MFSGVASVGSPTIFSTVLAKERIWKRSRGPRLLTSLALSSRAASMGCPDIEPLASIRSVRSREMIRSGRFGGTIVKRP